MCRVTKNIAVITTDLRAYEAIETFWEEFPYYIKVSAPTTFINGYNEIDEAFAGDIIVWEKNGKFKTMRESVWNKIYGKHLKESLGEKKWLVMEKLNGDT